MPNALIPAAGIGLPIALNRLALETTIAFLIDLLDLLDGDADAELDADLEPEEDDDTIAEPDLGSLDRRVDQTGWAGGGADNREFDPAEREADGDEREPDDSGLGDADGADEQLGAAFRFHDAPGLGLAPTDRRAVEAATAALRGLLRRTHRAPAASAPSSISPGDRS